MAAPFDRIRARFLLPWLAAALFFSFVPGDLLRRWYGTPPDDPLSIALGSLLGSLLILAGPALHARLAGLRLAEIYGAFPAGAQLLGLAVLGVSMFGTGMVASYVLLAPISLAFPDFMQSLLFETMPVIYSAGPPYPLLGNLLGAVAVILAPAIAEEWFFRGLLLRRWTHQVGVVRAVIRTSLLFALLHMDPLGGFVFGVAMCGIYAHYRSLWAPTIVHAVNNGIAWSLAALDGHNLLGPELTSVSQLRHAWWIPAVGLLLALPLVLGLRSRYEPIATWDFATSPDRKREWPEAVGAST